VWLALAAAAPAALHPGDPEARLRAPGPILAAPPPGPRVSTPYHHDVTSDEPGVDGPDRGARFHAALGYAAYNVRARLESLDGYTGLVPTRLALLAGDGWSHWPLAPRRFGVTHVVLDPPLTDDDRRIHAVATSGGRRVDGGGAIEVWAVPHREWASFPPEVRTVAGEDAARAETGMALLQQRTADAVVEAASPFAAGRGRVLSVERGLEALRIEAEAEGDATLVVADAWWPGWEATLDGSSVPIYRADALVRAVRWPAGRHVLAMRYRPPEVRAGIVGTALGVVVLALGMALLRRRGGAPEERP
jgi:hypothetical protein